MRPAPAPMISGVGIFALSRLQAVRGGKGPAPTSIEAQSAAAGFSRPLLDEIGQKTKEPRALDRSRKLALLLGRHGRDAARHHLAPLGDVTLQELHVLVVDLRRLVPGEGAGLPAAVERAPGLDLRHAHRAVS